MKKKTNRLTSMILAAAMVLSLAPMSAFADAEQNTITAANGENVSSGSNSGSGGGGGGGGRRLGIDINNTNFPDGTFREYVKTHFDTDGNDILSTGELEGATDIDLSNQSLSSLTGIEYFTGLQKLNIKDTHIRNLDISRNTQLTELRCDDNLLQSVDVTKNTNLKVLSCSTNLIEILDLTKNTALTTLECSNNILKTLDLSKNNDITTIDCQNQRPSANYYRENGKFVFNLGEFVGAENLSKITSSVNYDAQTGIAEFETEPREFVYTVDCGSGRIMNVTVNLTAQLVDATAENFTFTPPASLIYDNTVKTASATLPGTDDDKITLKYYDEQGNEVTPQNPGTYTVKAFAEAGRYYNAVDGLVIGSFTISGNMAVIGDIEPVTYTGEPLTPPVTVKVGETALTENTDYTLVYEDNTNAGTGKVKVTYTGNYIGETEKTFEILQADVTLAEMPTVPYIVTGNSLAHSVMRGGKALDLSGNELSGTFDWVDETEIITVPGTYQKPAVFTPENTNYKPYQFDASIMVYPVSSGRRTRYYVVFFDSNGGSKVTRQPVVWHDKAEEPTPPTKDGYIFDGWYTDKELTKEYDFSSSVSSNIILYAAWTEKDASLTQIILTIGKTRASVFGKSKSNDVAPIIVNSRTMLPARFVAENLGASVEWNGKRQLVTIKGKHLKTNKDMTILITINDAKATVNGKEITLESPAFIENDRTYTPIRFVAETLGADVDWNDGEKQVIITNPQKK